jgi:hypothetical protein
MIVKNSHHWREKFTGRTTLSLYRDQKAMPSPEPVPFGNYRGFDMTLSFDTFSKEYRVTIKGTLSHEVKLDTDIHGNITRRRRW